MSRPTFKKGDRPTGLYAVGHPYADTHVKLDGRVVGMLSAPSATSIGGHKEWRVRLIIKAPEDAQWRWVTLKGMHATEATARAWVQQHWSTITERFPLHGLDMD